MGFSAGGHLASTLSTHYKEKRFPSKDTTGVKPDFSILIYPVISMKDSITHQGSKINLLGDHPSEEKILEFSNEEQVTADTPITFLVQAENDQAVPVMNSISYFLALKRNKVEAELHIYEDGGHGFGLGNTESNKNWTVACEAWLRANNLIWTP